MSGGTTTPEPPADAGASASGRSARRGWLFDHAGRLAGVVLGALAFAFVVFLAAIGFKPALFLVVLVVGGVATIAIGGRIRGA